MATNHDIATTSLDQPITIARDSTAGLTVIALLLALVLGLTAIDIQHQRLLEATAAGESQRAALDGRGKWGGYIE